MKNFLHLSDLHFSEITYNPFQIFSKRWIGNLNLALFRKKEIHLNLLDHFIDHLKELAPETILISGDFTSTALREEFKRAQNFILQLKERGIKIFAIPGNHDAYTKKAYNKKAFYQHFRNLIPFQGEFNFDLEKHKVAAFQLEEHLHLVLIDASCYTPYFQSNGVFSFEIEQHLQFLLDSIPSYSKIWICCHFPFFQHEHPKRILIGAKKLQAIIERYSNIELFFHGHTHRQAVCDLRSNHLPIISDSGSLTLKHRSTFNQISHDETKMAITRYEFNQKFTPVETQNYIRLK